MNSDLKILIIEDSESYRAEYIRFLSVYNDVDEVGDLKSAREALRRKVLELSPGWLSGHFHLARIQLAKNDAPAALGEIRQEQSAFWRLTGLALVEHALGNREESDAALRGLMQMVTSGAAYQLAQVHAFRGEIDAAFEWLDRAAATHDAGLTFAGVDPLLRSLHDDARWSPLLERNGLAVSP